MASRRRARQPQGIALISAAPEERPADSPSPESEDVLDELAGEGQRSPEARISRIDPATRRPALLDVVDASMADDGWIRDTYGGGDYRVLIYGTRDDGSFGYLKKQSRAVRIDSTIPFKGSLKERIAKGSVNGDAALVASPMAGTSMDDIMKAGVLGLLNTMAAASKAQTDAFAILLQNASRNPEPANTVEWDKVLPGIAATITALAGVFGGRGGDPMDIAVKMAGILKDNGSPKESIKDTLGALREIKELDIFGAAEGEEKGDAMLKLVGQTLPGILDLLKRESRATGVPVQQIARGAPQALPPGSPAPPSIAPAPVVPASPHPAPANTVPQDEYTPLEPYVAQLAQMAADNKDPHHVVGLVMAMAPQRMIAAIRELVGRDDATDVLTTRFAALQPYRVWTAQLVDDFRAEFFGEPDEPEGDDPEPVPEEPAGG